MSFCPSKDIHSIYLDDEMSAEIKIQYENHVNGCVECQKELARLRAVRNLFVEGKLQNDLDSEFLDKSFERLQLKMKYSNNVKKIKKSNFVFEKPKFIYAVSGIAAVALFALIVPLRLRTSSVNNTQVIDINKNAPMVATAIANNGFNNVANNVAFSSGKSMLISDNMDKSIVYSGNEPVLLNGNLQKNIKEKRYANNLLNNITVVKPDIDDNSISIRITIPGFDSVPVTTEIMLPVNVITGQN